MLELILMCALTCSMSHSAGILFPYPSETREVVPLNGVWQFTITPDWHEEKGYTAPLLSSNWIPMPVPSSYNDITVNSTIRDYVGWVWYRRSFFCPWRWQQDQQRVFLRFGSVHYTALVWVNGHLVGSHSGGHLPFVLEVSSVLNYGISNEVAVAVNNTLTQHTLPQGSIVHTNDTSRYPPGYIIYSYTFDFYNYAGIHRPVYLYTTPQSYINDITVVTRTDGTIGTVAYEVIYAISENDIWRNIQCQVLLLSAEVAPVEYSSACQGELVVHNANFWWPVHMHTIPGYLYTLQVTLIHGEMQDIYRLPIGIRDVSWNEDGLRINSQPVYLQGFGKHEDSNLRGKGLDYPLLLRDHSLIEWIGANCYRTSHYPYAEEAMELADSHGIMIINESPAVNLDNFDAIMLEKHKAVMEEMIRRDKNRPSVIMWSVSNEAHTSNKLAGPHYRAVVEHVKSLDPTRPITFVTNQKAETDQAAQFMDIIGVNRYFAWYTDTGHVELIPHQIEAEFKKWHDTFHKPLFISEYGADAVSGMHRLPSFVWTEDYQVELLQQHFKAFDILRQEKFFIGELIWNFADFATAEGVGRVVGNRKGIFTRERQPKAAAYVLKHRYHLLAAEDKSKENLADGAA